MAVDDRGGTSPDSAMLHLMPRRLIEPPGLGVAVTLDEALHAELSRAQVRHRVTTGLWETIGRGRYLRTAALATIDDEWKRREVRHAAMAASAASALPGTVVALESAALVHGLPLLSAPRSVELVAPVGGWTGIRRGVRLHGLALGVGESMALPPRDGPPLVNDERVRVTTPARTWFDLACTRQLADALAVGDAVLRDRLCSREQIAAAATQAANFRGCRRVAQALPLLSPLRESPLESVSYAEFVDWGIPLPEMQVTIHDEEGFVGRVDFLWRDARVIGEADGAGKYEHGGVLLAERRREQRLRDLGYIVVRWTWDELMNEPWKVRLRILRALRAAA